MVALDLAAHMLSFEPYLSTPSLSKHVAQNSAYFFRLCFASFFRLSRTQNERYEAEITSNNQPDAGERGDVLAVGFGGQWVERPSAEAPMVGKAGGMVVNPRAGPPQRKQADLTLVV